MMQPEIEHAKSSVDSYTLPCGFVDAEGNLHKQVDVREMTGEEEEILAARNMATTKKINRILSRCTTQIGDLRGPVIDQVIPDLTQGDRIYLLMAIRRASLGDEMPFITKCPSCDQESQLIVDLSELESRPPKDPMIRHYDVSLPSSKIPVRMKVLTGRGEDAISKAANRGKDIITTAIFCRIETMDEKQVTMKDLLKLSIRDRNYLRDVWEDYEGGIDTDIEVECPACDFEYDTVLDIAQQGFFNPSAALRSWKKKSSF